MWSAMVSFPLFDDGNLRPRMDERFSNWPLDSFLKAERWVEDSPFPALGKTSSTTNYKCKRKH